MCSNQKSVQSKYIRWWKFAIWLLHIHFARLFTDFQPKCLSDKISRPGGGCKPLIFLTTAHFFYYCTFYYCTFFARQLHISCWLLHNLCETARYRKPCCILTLKRSCLTRSQSICALNVVRQVFQKRLHHCKTWRKFTCDKGVLQFDSFHLKNLHSDVKTQLFSEILKHLRI